jgi:hypothetical protein
MSKINLLIIGLIFLAVSLSCKSFMPAKATDTRGPAVDFNMPGKALDVKVQLDKKQTASGKVSKTGGTVSLTAADGSKFTLEVPANALDAETTITMTAVKTLDGAPLDKNTPTAVQLEPSGLYFKEIATLTIIPGKEIPIEEQIIFGYDGEGSDYHLAMIDPKSKDIKIKLMHFSGAGVGSGSDAAWAANLMIQAGAAETRLSQKLGEYLQPKRRETILETEGPLDNTELFEKMKSAVEQYEDQVVLKEIAAAELDCKHALKAWQDHISAGRFRRLLEFPLPSGFDEKALRLIELASKCTAPYQIVGGLDDWQTDTKVCDIMKPFTLIGTYGIKMELSGGLSGTYSYAGQFNAQGSGTYTVSLPDGPGKPGTMTGSGEGSAEGHTDSGTEKYTLMPIEPCN